MAERGKRSVVRVRHLGKLKTTVQMISTALLILSLSKDTTIQRDHIVDAKIYEVEKSNIYRIVNTVIESLPESKLFLVAITMFYISTILTVVSGGLYFTDAYSELMKVI
jgi:phosphatidylglycerophosphate synthase